MDALVLFCFFFYYVTMVTKLNGKCVKTASTIETATSGNI